METKCVFKFVAGALFVATGTASTLALAEELCYQTGFERPAFTPGQLDGQYEWHDPSRTTLVLPAAPLAGEQSLRVFGNKLNPLGPGIVGTRVARLFFYDAKDQTVEVSVDARLDASSQLVSGEISKVIPVHLKRIPLQMKIAAFQKS